MSRITKILVSVDFSEPSRTAVNYGSAMALRFDATLFLLHVVPSPAAMAYAFPFDSQELQWRQFEDAKKQMSGLLPAEYREKLRYHLMLRGGQVEEEICGLALDENVSLVVMGTHGRRAVGRWLLGSVTEHVLRRLQVPVMTVSHLDPRKELKDPSDISIRKILYATDLSEGASHGIDYAVSLAGEFNAELDVLNVVQDFHWAYSAEYLPADVESLMFRRIDNARADLEASLTPETRARVKVTPVVLEGTPYQEILRFAEERNVDLIVLNLQGRGFLERAVLGSTAERVVRGAHVPVLGVPVLDAPQLGEVSARKSAAV